MSMSLIPLLALTEVINNLLLADIVKRIKIIDCVCSTWKQPNMNVVYEQEIVQLLKLSVFLDVLLDFT